MPLTAGGHLAIIASCDLGGLGSKEGPAVDYYWVLPNIAPMLLPWLAILGLLAAKPNRCAAAWLIWLPFGCVMVLTQAATFYMPPGSNFLLDVISALAAGLAALWLLSKYLRRQHRFVTFLRLLPALAGFSLFALVARQGLEFTLETPQACIVLAVAAFVTALAISFGGLICQRRCRPIRLYAWLLLLLVAAWLVIVTPFLVFEVMNTWGSTPWSEFFLPVALVAAINFATLLPFLILSSASPFFRERLHALLNIKPEEAPD